MDKIFIIDGSSFIYRAYHAIRYLSNSKGFPTNAIYGFTSMLLSLQKEYKPTHITVVLDSRKPSFRKELYAEYKATRPKMPDDLAVQIPYIKKIVEAFRIHSFEIEGVEADDVIGMMAGSKEFEQMEIYIISSDKDLMQLITDRIKLLDTMKKKIIGPNEVLARFGVLGDKVIDVLGLSGDSSDNIPGVPGIGEKRARELIVEFGSIENLLNNIDKVASKSIKESLYANREVAKLSKTLVTLKKDIPITVDTETIKVKEADKEKLYEIFKELEFSKFIEEITPQNVCDNISIEKKYEIIFTFRQLEKAIIEIEKSSKLSIDLETTSLDPISATIVGISLSACIDNKAYYIPFLHNYLGAPKQLDLSDTLKKLTPIIESETIEKYGQNIKYDYSVLQQYEITIKNIKFDSMIADYLINPSRRQHNLSVIAHEYLGYKMTEFDELFSGREKNFALVDVEKACQYSCDDAFVVYAVKDKMSKILESNELMNLFNTIEIPLISILAQMELYGVLIDKELLGSLSKEFSLRMEKIESVIYTTANKKFNINSPKQLADILFDDLMLPVIRKTKTGRSTDSDVLESLASSHPLPLEILNYRKLAKLKSTYINALPMLINSKTGRVHTSFNQTGTQTGRLSSSDPNLQNIPIRTPDGKKIRESFIAGKNGLLLWADYSQIELRILAHISCDLGLINAFIEGKDIHFITASEIFDKDIKSVTKEERSYAKTINFGIVYGMSAYGLSKELSIPVSKAEEYIKEYFKKYPGVEQYMKKIVESARESGFVTTLFGRRRYIPEIKSPNKMVRENGERIAINTPIQGTAADLIKLSMIKTDEFLKNNNLATKMILQVHDELLFESDKNEVERVEIAIKDIMENIYKLKIPLVVTIHKGERWV